MKTRSELIATWKTGTVITESMFTELFGSIPTLLDNDIIEVTYDELKTLYDNNALVPNAIYKFTFTTVHYMFPDREIHVGNEETLLVLAISNSVLHYQAFSVECPTDIIHYSINSLDLADASFHSTNIIVPGFKGQIYYRKDIVNNNSTHYDFRNVKFRRWKLTPAEWDNETTYDLDSAVLYNDKIWVSTWPTNKGIEPIEDYSSIYPDGSIPWVVLSTDFYQSYLPTESMIGRYIIPADNTDYVDYYTFDPSSYSTSYKNNNIGEGNIEAVSLVTQGTLSYPTVLNNIVFKGPAMDNVFDYACMIMLFGPNIISNTFGSYNIGGIFGSYNIGGSFGKFNVLSIIGDNNVSISIGNSCYKNIISRNNFSIKLAYACTNCFINYGNSFNNIGEGNTNIIFNQNCHYNNIEKGNDTIIFNYNCTRCNIGSNNTALTIKSNVSDCLIKNNNNTVLVDEYSKVSIETLNQNLEIVNGGNLHMGSVNVSSSFYDSYYVHLKDNNNSINIYNSNEINLGDANQNIWCTSGSSNCNFVNSNSNITIESSDFINLGSYVQNVTIPTSCSLISIDDYNRYIEFGPGNSSIFFKPNAKWSGPMAETVTFGENLTNDIFYTNSLGIISIDLRQVSGSPSHIYNTYNCEIFAGSDGSALRYFTTGSIEFAAYTD